jgi:hypothetical protein
VVYSYKGIEYKAKGRSQMAVGKISPCSIYQNPARDLIFIEKYNPPLPFHAVGMRYNRIVE